MIAWRLSGSLAMVAGFALASSIEAGEQADAQRAGLQALNDYIGTWHGSGGPDKAKPDPKDPIWKETLEWCWRFKGDDSWLSLRVTGGKHIDSAEIHFLPAKKQYVLRLVDANKLRSEFSGKLDKGYLTFERTEPNSGETQQFVMNTAADGVRFVYRFAVRPKGRTLFTKAYQVGASKDGESLGAAAKRNECIVTGGLGTIPVTYMGETFYVCCSGCRDAFNEDPAKFVRAYKEKKIKGGQN